MCDPWTVRDMVRHVLGSAEGSASIREMIRQQVSGVRHKDEFGGNALDATNALQVEDHRHLGAQGLIDQLRSTAPAAVKGRMSKTAFVGWINIKLDQGGSNADGMPRRLNMGDLLRVILTRDVWLHRIDISRALNQNPRLDRSTDGRIVEDVMKEWADRHGQPFDLTLTGPVGGHYVRPGDGPVFELDAIDFCWILSGRGEADSDSPGADLLTSRVLF